MRKPAFFICENKDADQLRSNYCAADQRRWFRYTDSTIPLLPIYEIFKLLAIFCGCTAWFVLDLCWTCRKSQRPVFSQRGSFRNFTTDFFVLQYVLQFVKQILKSMIEDILFNIIHSFKHYYVQPKYNRLVSAHKVIGRL